MRSLVLRLLPLALVAVSAQANVIFNPTDTFCTGGVPITLAAPLVSGVDTLTANPLPVSNGAQGAVLNGQCSEEVLGSLLLDAGMFGDFTGSDMPLPPTVPVAFDFTISIDAVEILDWYVEIFINKTQVFSTTGSSSSSFTPILGGGFANTSTFGNQSLLGWTALVGVDCLLCEGTLTIDLGNSSLRINPVSSSVPEPSTVSLLALGGVLLWYKRRTGSRA